MLDTPSPQALLVDHKKSSHDRYAAWFPFSGFRIEMAATVADAVDKTLALQPHIIATAIQLGLDDGCDLCQRLKADERTRRIPPRERRPQPVRARVERRDDPGLFFWLIARKKTEPSQRLHRGNGSDYVRSSG